MSNSLPRVLVYRPDHAQAYAAQLQMAGMQNVMVASTEREAASLVGECDIVFAWKFPLQVLNGNQSVRWFQSMGAGVEDLVESTDVPGSITITRVVHQFGPAMAEYVFAYILGLTKHVVPLRNLQERRQWQPMRLGNLQGKVIGIAGLGSIGLEMVRKARAFDMTVYGLSASGTQRDKVDRHFQPGEWLDFVSDLDYLVLVLPLTSKTKYVVNHHVLSAMKSSATVVNVGRGALIDETALVEALDDGIIAGAVLDVFQTEPLPTDHRLWGMENVVITPHISGPSVVEDVSRLFLENYRRYREGIPLIGEVDRRRGY